MSPRFVVPSALLALSIVACSHKSAPPEEGDYQAQNEFVTADPQPTLDEEESDEDAPSTATVVPKETPAPEREVANTDDAADAPATSGEILEYKAKTEIDFSGVAAEPTVPVQPSALARPNDAMMKVPAGRSYQTVEGAATAASGREDSERRKDTAAKGPAKTAITTPPATVVGGTASTGYYAPPPPPRPTEPLPDVGAGAIGSESYQNYGVNDMTMAELDRHSTFSIDVDTASYTIARRKLNEGALPPEAAVRVEEFVNYFPYRYASPGAESGSAPFAVHLEAAPNPFESNHHLVRVGIKGKDVEQAGRKALHLTFLVDTSGSMATSDKIGLAKSSLEYLVSQLGEEDTVAIATYAGSTSVVLKPTPASDRTKILSAIQNLGTGGGTSMGSGMELAYQMASESYLHGAENRVVVLSDGDANIGRTTHEEILATIKQYSERGITLSTIGYGMGNYKDVMMEQLANQGDGNYYYIDTMAEAKKVFGEDMTGTMQVIAKDVKIQVEFNPDSVYAYRLIGYENRDIADKDFRNDQVDAGEVGAGHMVTALYDVVLKDGYRTGELVTVRLRAKPPGPDSAAKEWSTTLQGKSVAYEFGSASKDMRLAFGAASFAELLRGSPYAQEIGYDDVLRIVEGASRGGKEEQELIGLIKKAAALDNRYGPVSMR